MKIGAKILTGSLVSVLLTVLVTSFISFRLTRDVLVDVSLLESETSIKSNVDEFNVYLNSLRTDLVFLSNTPPVQGMIRALDNQGIDPKDGSTYQEWANRLSDIFLPLAKSKPDYMQIRYLDENGNELVRIDSNNGEAKVVSAADLQNKQDRYYFKDTISLSPGQIYISNIDLNKEGSPPEVVVPFQPTIRYATPVVDSQGEKRGIIITNINITSLLATLNQPTDRPNQKHFLLGPAGFYLVHPQSDKEWGDPENLNTGFNLYQEYPDSAAEILSGSTNTLIAKGNIMTHTPVQIDPNNSNNYIVILKETPPFTPISVRNLSLIIGAISLGLIILSSLLAYYIAQSISSGVTVLQKDVEIITSGNLDHEAVIKSQDEIGSLAKSFNTMTAAIKDSRSEIDAKVKEQTQEIVETGNQLQNQRLAILNVLEDVEKDREIDKMKTEFISLASHQLRTPLSAMKWFLEMLLGGDVGKLTKEQQEQVENINQSNERMISLVNALLNVSRIESGRLSIEPKPTHICNLAKQTITELKTQANGKTINLDCTLSPKECTLNIDPKLISEVFQNLISNSIKYTTGKGKVLISIKKDKDQIVSTITDWGLGIPKDQQPRIFEKFFRADNVLKLETDGTGLGLYLVKKIIEASGGKIGFNSVATKGTTFWFTIPVSGSKAHSGEVKITSGLAGKTSS